MKETFLSFLKHRLFAKTGGVPALSVPLEWDADIIEYDSANVGKTT